MVLHLCLPDSCEENENSSSHCIKLLIINSSLEIGKLRHYRYLYRALVWGKAEISDRVPFCFILVFRRIWVLGNPSSVCRDGCRELKQALESALTVRTAGEQGWSPPYPVWWDCCSRTGTRREQVKLYCSCRGSGHCGHP